MRRQFQRIEADAAADRHVQRKPRTPESCMSRSLGLGDIRRRHGDAAQTLRMVAHRLQHQAVVGAVHAHLHQHAARQAEPVEHAQVFAAHAAGGDVAAHATNGYSQPSPTTWACVSQAPNRHRRPRMHLDPGPAQASAAPVASGWAGACGFWRSPGVRPLPSSTKLSAKPM
jgi:hypothetical protein